MIDKYSESLRNFYRESNKVEDRILGKYSRPQNRFQAQIDAAMIVTIRIDASFVTAQSKKSHDEEKVIAKKDAVILTVAMSEAAKGDWSLIKSYLQETARIHRASSTLFSHYEEGTEERDADSEREAMLWTNIARSI